jgi:outer membrane lipoprotein carrier protein
MKQICAGFSAPAWVSGAHFHSMNRWLAALVAIVMTATTFVAAPARAAAVDQLRGFLADTQSARGEFSQRVIAGKKTTASSGRFEFERPGRFRWTYVKPYEQTIVADGQKLYMYDRDLNQVTVKKMGAALPASPASILFGTGDFERDFQVRDDGERDGLAWVIATPRVKESQFESIGIGMKDAAPAAMRIADSFGQITELTFSHFERNPKLDAALFRFVPPQGADVLEDKGN